MIMSAERQDLARLGPSLALRLQQVLEEGLADLAEISEALTEQLLLTAAILRRPMFESDLALAHAAAR